MYVEGGGKKGRWGGGQAISDWLEGGLNFFIKKFRAGPQFDRKVYFKRGSLAKNMGKQ